MDPWQSMQTSFPIAEAGGVTRMGGTPLNASGRLRLQVPMAFAVHQLAKHLPDFHARFPKVTVELHAPGADADAGADHELTIHWRQLPPGHAARARRLARSDVVLCAAPEYLDRHGRPTEPGALGAHSLLLPPGPVGRGAGLELVRGSAAGGAGGCSQAVVPAGAACPLFTPHAELAYASALAGLGICGLPSFVVEDAVLEGALERVLPAWRLDRCALWACTPAGVPEAGLAQAMLGFLLEVFGGQDRDPWLGPSEP